MGGNDQLDSVLSHYSVYIRSKRWTMRIASWALDVAVCMSYLNARLLNVNDAKKTNAHVIWLMSLINGLIKKANINPIDNDNDTETSLESSENEPEPRAKKAKHSNNSLRLSTNPPHFPVKLSKETRKNCVLCCQNSQKCKKTYFECDQCGVGLCVDKCFKLYHTKSDL